MRVLVGCEFSGAVRDAFLARGHQAMSCDLLPSESQGPPAVAAAMHYQGDVRDVLDGDADGRPWDLAIFHPDCTFLCRAGQRWLNAPDDDRPGKLKGRPRQEATALAGLPPLVATDDARRLMNDLPKSEANRIHYASPGPDRWKLRSRTFSGVAAAMADQWGRLAATEVAS